MWTPGVVTATPGSRTSQPTARGVHVTNQPSTLTTRKQPSIRPQDFTSKPVRKTCAEVDYTLVYRRSVTGKAVGYKHHADCHVPGCKRCGTPQAKTRQALERRGYRNEDQRESAKDLAHFQLQTSGCTRYLRYGKLNQKERQQMLHALRRSRTKLDGVALITQDGGTQFFGDPASAQFIEERLGKAAEAGELGKLTLDRVLDRGFKAVRRWGVHSVAKSFLESNEVYNPPTRHPRQVSITEFNCHHLDTEDNLRHRGLWFPGDRKKHSIIDDESKPVVESKERGEVEMTTLQEMRQHLLDLKAGQQKILELLEQMRAGRITAEEFERRSRLVLGSDKLQ
jgi:hypothetical protein